MHKQMSGVTEFLVPLFLVNIGMQLNLEIFRSRSVILLALLLTLIAVMTKLNVPTALGVPVMVAVPIFAPPETNVKFDGAAPAEIVGVGTPFAVTLKAAIGVPKVPDKVAGLVKFGVTGVAAGWKTLLAADAGPGPAAFVAMTVQV